MFDDPNILTNGIWIERNILQMDFQDQLTTINKYNPAIIFRIIFPHWSDIYGCMILGNWNLKSLLFQSALKKAFVDLKESLAGLKTKYAEAVSEFEQTNPSWPVQI